MVPFPASPAVPPPRTGEQEALRARALDQAKEAVFGVLPSGRFFYANDAACRALGYTREELTGLGISDIDPCVPADEWAARWEELCRTGSRTSETIHRRKDGLTFPVEVSSSLLEVDGALLLFSYARDLSARRAAEAARQASEKRYRALFDSMSDACASVDLQGRITDFNDAFRELLGRPVEEILRLGYEDITPQRWHAAEQRILQEQVLARGYSDVYEKEYLRGDGRPVPVELKTFLLRDADGRPAGMSAIIRDITERKRMLEELRAAEDRLKTVVSGSEAVIFQLDTEGRFTLSEGRGLAGLGLAPGQVVGRSALEFYAEYPEVVAELRKALAGRPSRATLKVGSMVFDNLLAPQLGADGQVEGVIGIATDITARVQAEDALRQSEARFRAIFEHEPECVKLVAEDGTLLDMNPAGLAMIEVGSRDQAVGGNVLKLVAEEWKGAFRGMLTRVFRGEAVQGEFEIVGFKGRRLRMETHAVPLRRPDGGIACMLAVTRDVTARRMAEAELRASEGRFGILFQAMTEGVALNELVRDPAGEPVDYRILDVNPAFEAQLGISAARAKDALAGDLFDLGQAPHLEAFTKVAGSGRATGFETYLPPLDKHLRISAVALGGDRFATIYEDITEQIRSLAALRESETSYRGLFDGVYEAIYIQDGEGRFLDVNRGAMEMYGYRREDFIGRTPEFLAAPGRNDLPAVAERLQRAFAGEPQTFEFWGLRRNGETFPKEVRLYPGTYFGQEVVIALSIDISERRRTEAALRESEARLRSLYENTPDAMFWLRVEGDGEFLVDDVNPAQERRLGVAKAQLVGRRIRDILPAGLAASVTERYAACVAAGSIMSYEEKAELAGGSFVFQTQLVPLLDAEGRVTRIVGTSKDITQERNMEEALRQAQKLESLGVLAGGIAHDFNNLLTAMLGNLNLAQMSLAAGAPAQAHLDAVERTLLKASDLTKQMLAYSGKGRFVVKAQDLNHIVQEMVHLLQVSISKKAELRLDLHGKLPSIRAEAAQVQQIVMNLVTNASDALGQGPGAIRVATFLERLDQAVIQKQFRNQAIEPGEFVVLEVRDTGCGIADDVMDRIFDPFFTTKASGRGLGLSALLGILRGHHAGIRIRSEPGRGSTFQVFFPVSGEEVEEGPPSGPRLAASLQGTVLLVDDEEMILESTGMALESLGLKVEKACDGVQGLERFLELGQKVSLVLMDLSMPRMDGATAFLAMRQARPEIPVLLSSGYDPQESGEDLMAQGLAGFIQKPYRVKDLAEAVVAALRRTTGS